MEITFHKVMKIKIDAVKNQSRSRALWLQIRVCDQEGENIINCFSGTGETIPISLNSENNTMISGEKDDD